MTSVAKGCAYCGSSGPFTREHLLPRALSARTGENLEANILAAGSDKVLTSEPVIRDVCKDCNNGPLSKLDDYICSLYEKYFRHYVRAGDCVKFVCDFDPLQRWLLKIAYNHTRARQWPRVAFNACRTYILGNEANRPPSRIILQLVPPFEVKPGTIKEFPTLTEAPIFNRVAVFEPSYMPGMLAGFLVTLYSYYFYVVIDDLTTAQRIRKRMFDAFLKAAPGGYQLLPDKPAIIYSSSLNMLEMAKRSDPLVRNILEWDRWKDRGTAGKRQKG